MRPYWWAPLAYATCSILMNITAKYLFMFGARLPVSFLCMQHGFSLVLYISVEMLKSLKLRCLREKNDTGWPPWYKFSFNTVLHWLPVSLLFAIMLVTSSLALSRLSIGMISIFKSFSTLGVSLFDDLGGGWATHSNWGVCASVTLMVTSGVVAGWSDIEFDAVGYLWMIINVISSVSYLLYSRLTMSRLNLPKHEVVKYNSVISLPFFVLWLAFSNETSRFNEFNSFSQECWLVLAGNLIVSYAIGIFAVITISAWSPTTYAMTGSSAKLPLTLLSIFVFKKQLTTTAYASTFIALLASVWYAYATAVASSSKLKLTELTEHNKKVDSMV